MHIIYTLSTQRRAALALACLFTLGVPAAQAQTAAPGRADAGPVANGPQAGDPSRWYVEDATQAEQLRTLRKEIGAALSEAQKDCKSRPQAERAACLKDAQEVYRRDMAGAQRQRAAAHPQGAGTAAAGQQ